MHFRRSLLVLLSFGITALGQPTWSSWIGILAAALGYAFFWAAIRDYSSAARSCIAFVWFMAVQWVQLSWMATTDFQGYYIIGVYLALCALLGLQFAFFTWILFRSSLSSLMTSLGQAGLWTLFEWVRFQIFCGFAFNVAGISLSSCHVSLQAASLFGVLGLSFWVMFTNISALNLLQSWKSYKKVIVWMLIATTPYLFGFFHLQFYVNTSRTEKKQKNYSILLLQPGLLPSQKYPIEGRFREFIAPLKQWERIWTYIKESPHLRLDVLVLPEASVPFGFDICLYPLDQVREKMEALWGKEIKNCFPSQVLSPYSMEKQLSNGQKGIYVSNAFILKTLSNYLRVNIIAGLDFHDVRSNQNFNSAFFFSPYTDQIPRYDKRVLLPLAEYLPFSFLQSLTKFYGIHEFFSQGEGPKLFQGPFSMAPSICYEELFPNLMREARLLGAHAFINLTNDAWYPFSKLPLQHYTHGLIRSVENGIPLIRACNTGITAVIDSSGRTIAHLGNKGDAIEVGGALHYEVPLYQHKTLFMLWGNAGIIFISFSCILFSLIRKRDLILSSLRK